MKIQQAERIYEGTGVQQQVGMTIKSDALMIRKLSKDLYKNPLKACFRELLSNAIDACGLDPTGVRITLPSVVDKTLLISDLGIGMTHDFVVKRYSVIGESSKNDTDDQIGGFGMGKITSLALTNSFSIMCYDASEIRTYSCFLNTQGIPDIALTYRNRNDTKRTRGVDIRVPIDPTKFTELQQYAEYLQYTIYLTYGKTFEIVRKPFDEESFKKNLLFHAPGVGAILEKSQYYAQLVLCIGGIPYDISGNRYKINLSSYAYKEIIFFANIGEFGVTLSREEIEQSEKALLNLKLKSENLSRLVKEKAAAYFKEITAGKSEKEKLKEISGAKGKFYYDLINTIDEKEFSKYTSIVNYLQKDNSRFSLADVLYVNASLVSITKQNRYDSFQTNYSTDSYRMLVNDTSLPWDLVANRIVRASNKSSTLPSLLKNVKVIVHWQDKKTKQEVESAFPAIDCITATEILQAYYPDKKDFERNLKEVKNIERIRFKKLDTAGNVGAITIEEVEDIKDKAYYTCIEGNNFIPLFKVNTKEYKTLKAYMNKLNLSIIYLVPSNKEKYLDTKIFKKLDTILQDPSSVEFKDSILYEAAYKLRTTCQLPTLKNNLDQLKKLQPFKIPSDLETFIGKLDAYLKLVKVNDYLSVSFYLFDKNTLFLQEVQKMVETCKDLNLDLKLLCSKYPLITSSVENFQMYRSDESYLNQVSKYLSSMCAR